MSNEHDKDRTWRRRHPVMRTVTVTGDCDGYIARLRWGQDSDSDANPLPYWVDYEIVKAVGWGSVIKEPGRLSMQSFGDPADGRVRLYDGEMHPVEDIDEAEVHVEGFIKWDGCMQWTADAHTDDIDDIELLFECIRQTRAAAIEAMGERWHAHDRFGW